MKRTLLLSLIILGFFVSTPAFQQKTGTLKGKVQGEKGKPLADVDVSVMSSRTREVKQGKTDANGQYQLELEPDSYTISLDIEGYAGGTMRDMQQVEEGKVTEVKTIQLNKAKHTSRISGAVFDSNGASLAGVKLRLVRVATADQEKEHKRFDSVTRDYITNRRGEFAFRVPSQRARYKVTAALDGFVTQTKFVDVGESEGVPLAFTMEPKKK